MKKLFSLAAIASLFAASQASAIITPVTDTLAYAELDFLLEDDSISSGGVSETYNFVSHPGSSVTLDFQDNFSYDFWFFIFHIKGGQNNEEALFTNPSSVGNYEFDVNTGALDFNGSYFSSGYLVEWAVRSVVTNEFGLSKKNKTIGKLDSWSGKYTSEATHVPDTGSSLALLGLGLLGLVGLRRRFAK